LPLVPIVGFHLNQAHRQFRAGHTLSDLRAALEIDRRERAETEAIVLEKEEPRGHRILRAATVGAGTWLAVTFGLVASGVVHENQVGAALIVAPVLATLLTGAASNALDVQFIPTKIRKWWQTGIRERLWNSRAGEWLARRLGAPERSQLAGASAFRATEAALGVAASELFAALPKEYKEQLGDLPAIVDALEMRAAAARAEIEALAALAPSESGGTEVLAVRKKAAATHLADSVAALEGIRLDLLRLHAGAVDLAPLTTLMDAARLIGEDLGRLAEAQREVEGATRRRLGAERTPTPA
jgi:serine/threonine-protein kinase